MEPTGSLISSHHKINRGNRGTLTSIILFFYLEVLLEVKTTIQVIKPLAEYCLIKATIFFGK